MIIENNYIYRTFSCFLPILLLKQHKRMINFLKIRHRKNYLRSKNTLSMPLLMLIVFIVPLNFLYPLKARAQFFQGVGLTLGGNLSNQRWQLDSIHYNKNQSYKFGGHVGLFVEYMRHDYMRMITELQYFQEGSNSKISRNTVSTNYFCFNNFFKLRQELYDVTPYFLIGPKLKYLYTENGVSGFKPIHLSMYAGVGFEFLYHRPWLYILEIGYDHDIDRALSQTAFQITNKTICIKAGIKFQIEKKVKGCRSAGL